jgi:hypothetical protein
VADDTAEVPGSPMQSAWVRIVETAHELIQPKIDRAKAAHVTGLLDTFESEMSAYLAPIIEPLLADPSTPAEVKPLLEVAVANRHFGGSVVVGIAIGAILGPVIGGSIAPALQGITNTAWLNHFAGITPGGAVPLSPAEGAAAVVKGLGTVDSLYPEISKSGVAKSTFQLMANVYGRSFGFELALMLLRRGDIDRAEFDRIIHYSDVRNDFIPDILKAMFVPLSVGEVVTANIKGHLDDATAVTYLNHAGVDGTKFQPLLKAAAGRPLGLMEMYTVMHRGGATQADIDQTVRQSDVNDAWLKFVPYLKWHYPPLFQVERAVKAGFMTAARATTILGYEGYEPQDVDAVVKAAESTATTTVKEASLSQILRMLEVHLITETDALARIEKLKFDPGTAQLIIELAARLREENLLNAAIRKVGTLYVGRKITQPEAAADLGAAAVPAASQTLYFKYWDIERAANIHRPTPSQIVNAYRRKLITAAETKLRLNEAGVADADLPIIVGDVYPPTKVDTAAIAAVVNA